MSSKSGFHYTATLSLTTALLLWSTVPLFLRSFIHEIDGWTANGFRYPFGSIIWIVPLFYLVLKKRIDLRIFRIALIPSLVNILAQMFWALTPYYLTPGFQIFFAQTSILFGITTSFFLFPDETRLIKTKWFWVGILLCITGFVGMNILKGNFQGEITPMGILIVLLHAFFIGMYAVSIRYYMREIKPWLSFSVICFYTSIGLFALMFLFGDPIQLLTMRLDRIVMLCISAFVGISFAHILFYHALIHIGVSISSSCKLLMPFLTAFGSYYIYGERFSMGQWLSGILILGGAGILMMSQQFLRQNPHE